MEECKIEKLYNLQETIATKIFEGKTYPWEVLLEISDFILELGKTLSEEEYNKIGEDVWISKTATVAPTAYIKGPTIICKDAEIRHCAFIRGKAIVGEGAVVGNSTELKNVILFNKVQVPHYNYVGDSIIGKNSRIGSGVIVANRAFSQSEVVIKDENKNPVKLNREAIGVILGDNARIGSNSTTSPGTFIGKFTWIYPHTCIHGFIPELKKVYDKQNIIMIENERKVLYKSTDWNYGNYK